jgi:hypothetical protein
MATNNQYFRLTFLHQLSNSSERINRNQSRGIDNSQADYTATPGIQLDFAAFHHVIAGISE